MDHLLIRIKRSTFTHKYLFSNTILTNYQTRIIQVTTKYSPTNTSSTLTFYSKIMTKTKQIKPFILGICGGSASGKTTIASTISTKIKDLDVAILSMDSFYKVLDKEQHEAACRSEYNFDCPDAFDFDSLKMTLKQLREGLPAEVPVYDFVTHSRATKAESMKPADIIIFEGIMTFHDRHIVELLDLKVFVDANDELRLARRMKRDVADRGQNLEGILKQYKKFVKPAYEKYIEPMKMHADIIIPNGGEGSETVQQAIVEYACAKFFSSILKH